MTLTGVVKNYIDELRDGSAHIVIYKFGRSWFSDLFYSETDDENPQLTK